MTLATDLVDEPQRFQDSVIVHELLHLCVMNHARLFTALMTAHVQGWRGLGGDRNFSSRGGTLQD